MRGATYSNLFVSTNLYTLGLYNEEFQTTIATSHKPDCITTDYYLLCFALLESNTVGVMNFLQSEGLSSTLLENSITTACFGSAI